MPEINPLRITPPPGTPEANNPLAPDWMRNLGSAAADWMQRQHLQSQAMGFEDPATGLPTAAGLRNALAQYPKALVAGSGSSGGSVVRAFSDIRPPSESVSRAMDATFEFGKDLGPTTMPIDALSGGISSAKTETSRVANLKTKMSGDQGYVSRLIVDSDGNVIEGQHRLEALRQLGATEVPVHVVHDLSAGIDTDGLKTTVQGAQTMHSDQRKQLVGHLLDALHDERGSVANVRANYDPPVGYEKAWNAALDFLGNRQ